MWQVAISFDKTLSWSDQTGRALSAKVENKKIPTSQKNLLTSPLECDTIRMSRGRQERTTSPQCVVGWSKTKSPYRTKKFKKPLDKPLRVWYNKGTGWAGVREQPTSNALRLPQVMVSAHPPPCKTNGGEVERFYFHKDGWDTKVSLTWKRSPLENVGSTPTTASKFFQKGIDKPRGLWYNKLKRWGKGSPTKGKTHESQ